MGGEEPTSLLSLRFLPRPWGGQSCPDLAQGLGSTSNVSLKVRENPKGREGRGFRSSGRGRAGPENPDLQVRYLKFSNPPSATDSRCNPGQVTPHFSFPVCKMGTIMPLRVVVRKKVMEVEYPARGLDALEA